MAWAAGWGKLMARWRVDRIGKKLQHVGTIEAESAAEAADAAIRDLRVEPALRSKLVVTKIEPARKP